MNKNFECNPNLREILILIQMMEFKISTIYIKGRFTVNFSITSSSLITFDVFEYKNHGPKDKIYSESMSIVKADQLSKDNEWPSYLDDFIGRFKKHMEQREFFNENFYIRSTDNEINSNY